MYLDRDSSKLNASTEEGLNGQADFYLMSFICFACAQLEKYCGKRCVSWLASQGAEHGMAAQGLQCSLWRRDTGQGPSYWSLIMPSKVVTSLMLPTSSVTLAGNDSVPLMLPSAMALLTAFSISFWELTPTILRNFRMLMLKVSSSMIALDRQVLRHTRQHDVLMKVIIQVCAHRSGTA